jgi:hypothetical protein
MRHIRLEDGSQLLEFNDAAGLGCSMATEVHEAKAYLTGGRFSGPFCPITLDPLVAKILIGYLQHWLDTGKLFDDKEQVAKA